MSKTRARRQTHIHDEPPLLFIRMAGSHDWRALAVSEVFLSPEEGSLNEHTLRPTGISYSTTPLRARLRW